MTDRHPNGPADAVVGVSLQAFEDEVRRRRHDLELLQTSGMALAERGAGPLVEPELKRLNKRWQDLSAQLARHKAAAAVSISDAASDSGGPEDLLQAVLRLLEEVGALQQRLRSWELSTQDFSQLQQQDEQLKVAAPSSGPQPALRCSFVFFVFFSFFF